MDAGCNLVCYNSMSQVARRRYGECPKCGYISHTLWYYKPETKQIYETNTPIVNVINHRTTESSTYFTEVWQCVSCKERFEEENGFYIIHTIVDGVLVKK